MLVDPPAPPSYVLGHSDFELRRLETQARLVDPVTRNIFVTAGLKPGMRVLDVGSGAGDVAFLVADLVGPSGAVIGTDQSAAALAKALERAEERGLANVTFREGDPSTLNFDLPFDAIVGRYVLQFQKAPARLLADLKPLARKGGVIAFHELAWIGMHSSPNVPLYDQCVRWVEQTLQKHGTESRMGLKLHAAYVDAGLSAPALRYESLIAAGEGTRDLVRLVVDAVVTLWPQMERLGVATAEEVGLETLAERVIAEVTKASAVLVARAEIGAWCRT